MADPRKESVQKIISELMDKVITKVTVKDPFIPEEHRMKKPIYAALVPDEIFQGAHFERRFTTPFGKLWQVLAQAVASSRYDTVKLEHKIPFTIKQSRLTRIQEILNELDNNKRKPSWVEEKNYILDAEDGDEVELEVIADLYLEMSEPKTHFAIELKAPLPNSDQTKVSKEKLLKLYAMTDSSIDEAFFCLPYNPFGKKEDYNHSYPFRWFNMTQDEVVLIGDEFWDFIGGVGTYKLLIDAVDELGLKYKTKIYEEFLGIEPPDESEIKSEPL